jgi:NADH-quinone oxidoreductase subunit M
MVLAGVLLKLGGVGLIRFYRFSNLIIKDLRFVFFLLSLFFTGVLCFFQRDFKKIIAFSSIFHISLIPIIFFHFNLIGAKSILLIMFVHGLVSPLLFFSVGLLSSIFSSRQLIVSRGLYKINPLLFFSLSISFFFTLPAPPLIRFYCEFISVLSILNISLIFLPLILFFYLIFSLVYNLN